jgi:hypothetical protein
MILLQACNDSSAVYKGDPKILRGEWLLDSIRGKTLTELNWIYFLDSSKFYKFSDYSKSYLIDSSLAYDSSFVYDGNQKRYKILFVDSIKLVLEDSLHRTFFYKRWRKNDLNDNVNRFLSRIPYKVKLNGYWEVVSFERPGDYYDEATDNRKLDYGNILYFSDNGMVTAFKSQLDTSELFKYSYRIFPDEIYFYEYDMVIGNKLIELTDTTLIFDSRNRFRGSLYKLRKLKLK